MIRRVAALVLVAVCSLIPNTAAIEDDRPWTYANGCHLDLDQSTPRDCPSGEVDSERVAILLGDSHAAQWLPALEGVASERGWRLQSHTKSACTPWDVRIWHSALGREFHECEAWRDSVLAIVEDTRPTVVFVASARLYNVLHGEEVVTVRENPAAWSDGMTATLYALVAHADYVVVMSETPWLGIEPFDGYTTLERGVAEAVGVQFLDGVEWFCSPTSCDLGAVYRDSHHLAASYAVTLADELNAAIPEF